MQMFCYYCLQEGHLASYCPLRAQERTSEAIEKLGHQSLQSIDKIVSAQKDIAERVVDIGSWNGSVHRVPLNGSVHRYLYIPVFGSVHRYH